MLATYSVGGPQDASKLSFVALYVGKLQCERSPRCIKIVLCSPVCWQPTAWEVPKMHQSCPLCPVCWQTTVWEVPKMHQNCPLQPCMLANYSVRGSQGASKLSFVALYVGCHSGRSARCIKIVLCSPVCWQPTAWEVPKMHQSCPL